MRLYFLSADRPLTKSYSLDPHSGALIKTAYPHAYEFTSYEEDIANLGEFAAAVSRHAAKGHCLLKGELQRPLVSESRRGSTNPSTPTWWACLDLDGALYATPDDFMHSIGQPDASYVLHWSASMGIDPSPGLRCHIYVLLPVPMSPSMLKQWLQALNFDRKDLADGLELTASGFALKYPLDISTCQNDKLIYAANPIVGAGLVDPYPGNRVTVVSKANATLTLDPRKIPGSSKVDDLRDGFVKALRESHGMPARKNISYKTTTGGMEYLAKPDKAVVTGMREDRGFRYLNLNDGDSWGYYHPVNNPDYILNFKGEPNYKTSELLPEYWASLQQAAQQQHANADGIVVLGFRDVITSKYYAGTYNEKTKALSINKVDSETQLRHYMKENGRVMGDVIPTWTLLYDPSTLEILDRANQRLNTYIPPPHRVNPQPAPAECPAGIWKIIRHAVGNNEAQARHFLNWLAFICQRYRAPGTAWILQGTEGTGKGAIFQIMSEVLGPTNCAQRRMDEMESEFTKWAEGRQFIFVDEAKADMVAYGSKYMSKIKSFITEPLISVRKMYSDHYSVRNWAGWLFSSNMPNPMEISPGDRRFNVGDYQGTMLVTDGPDTIMTRDEVAAAVAESPAFYAWLMAQDVDDDAAKTPARTDARRSLIEQNRATVDKVSDAFRTGDLQYFWEQLPDYLGQAYAQDRTTLAMEKFRKLVFVWVKDPPKNVTRDELHVVFNACLDKVPTTPTKFTNFIGHHKLKVTRVRHNGRTVAGMPIAWNLEDETWLQEARQLVKEAEDQPTRLTTT